jgi:hypothetical protein
MICITEEEDKTLFFEGTPQCKCKLHIHIQCLQRWLEVNQPRQCPLCRSPWEQTPERREEVRDTLEESRGIAVFCMFMVLGCIIGVIILEAIR